MRGAARWRIGDGEDKGRAVESERIDRLWAGRQAFVVVCCWEPVYPLEIGLAYLLNAVAIVRTAKSALLIVFRARVDILSLDLF